MQTESSSLSELCRRNWRNIRSTLAVRHESRCGARLLQSQPNFVQAAEGALLDCGLVNPSKLHLSPCMTGRSHVDVPNNKEARILHGFDYKLVRPYIFRSRRGILLYRHVMRATNHQVRDAVAYIVGSPFAPRRVVVIPRWCLDQRNTDTNEKGTTYSGPDIALTSLAFEPFPPEWAPFEGPLEEIGNMIKSMGAFLFDGETWCHPCSQMIIPNLPRPKPRDLSRLLSSDDDRRQTDFLMLQRLWKATKKHGTTYMIRRLLMQPSVGDFHFEHIPSRSRAAVEVKVASTILKHDGTLVFEVLGHPFSSGSHWDWLLCTDKRETGWTDVKETALKATKFRLIPRNHLPEMWGTETGSPFIWKPEQGIQQLEDYLILWTSDEEFVAKLEMRLNDAMSNGYYRACRADHFTPYRPAWLKTELAQSFGVVNSDKEDDTPGRWSQAKWMSNLQHHLLGSCKQRRHGTVLSITGHPVAPLIYSPFCVPETTFEELCYNSPSIFLNAATISVNDEIFATDLRRPLQFQSLLQTDAQTIFILEPSVSDNSSKARRRSLEKVYLVPSVLLDLDDFTSHIHKVKQFFRDLPLSCHMGL